MFLNTHSYNTAASYEIFKDLDSPNMIVYDNYTPGTRPNPEIHCRFGTGEALTVEQIQADNGWLYVLSVAVDVPKSPTVAITYQGTLAGRGTTQFLSLIEKAGLTSYMNSLSNTTL
jgi:hypothetical protein